MENKELNEEKEFDEEKKLKDVSEMVKVTRILQDILDNKISNIIESELKKNNIEKNLAIEVKIDVDFYN